MAEKNLIFNRKTSLVGNQSFSHSVFKKRVPSANISKEAIKKIAKDFNFTRTGGRGFAQRELTKARPGGWSRDEIKGILDKAIQKGYATESQARDMIQRAGVTGKRFRHFDDISEANAKKSIKGQIVSIAHGKQENLEQPKPGLLDKIREIREKELKEKLESQDKKFVSPGQEENPQDGPKKDANSFHNPLIGPGF